VFRSDLARSTSRIDENIEFPRQKNVKVKGEFKALSTCQRPSGEPLTKVLQLPKTIAYTCGRFGPFSAHESLEGLRAIPAAINSSQIICSKMSIFCRLSGKHYWSVPHRETDRRLVQVCYECGAERTLREFHDDFAIERLKQSLNSARSEVAKLSTASSTQDRIAVGEVRVRKFLLVK
jgi:hypothetical protein